MGMPSITERKHFRLVMAFQNNSSPSDLLQKLICVLQIPGDPEEPTSTIVLTSKDSYFVDVRILKDKYQQESSQQLNTKECIDWAFAGRSQTTANGGSKVGTSRIFHTVWEHWIDSRSDDPGPDEGDMLTQEDGDVVERGMQKHPLTGEDTEYEELWHDLEVKAFGKKQNRSSLVLKVYYPEVNVRGMAIKIGGWCQGLLKAGDNLTIERWEWKANAPGANEASEQEGKQVTRTHNDWSRTFKYGDGFLPCERMCSSTEGRLGLNAVIKGYTGIDMGIEAEWKVVEEYYW